MRDQWRSMIEDKKNKKKKKKENKTKDFVCAGYFV